MLLDENFPNPPGFDPSAVDQRMQLVSLRDFDAQLVGRRTPDWYLYLRAEEAQFDALVTRDWRQSAQAEEMWALSHTNVSVVTWSDPINDAIAEWGQLLAYMTEILKLIQTHGHRIVLLPTPRLNVRNTLRASDALGRLAADEGRSNQQVRREAQIVITEWLEREDQSNRFAAMLGLP
jgi:hypothetical protein